MRRAGALDVWLACYALVYGVWLLLPMSSFGTTPAFAGLRQIASEEIWGAVIALSGLLKLAAIWRGGTRPRELALGWLMLLWAFLAWSAVLSNLGSTAVPTYALAALGSGFCYVRLSRAHEQ